MSIELLGDIVIISIWAIMFMIIVLSFLVFFIRVKKYIEANVYYIERVFYEDNTDIIDNYLLETLKSKGYINPNTILDITNDKHGLECPSCRSKSIGEHGILTYRFVCNLCGSSISLILTSDKRKSIEQKEFPAIPMS